MANDELKGILSGEIESDKVLSSSMRSLIEIEINERALKKASKPHWSVTTGILATVIGTTIGIYTI